MTKFAKLGNPGTVPPISRAVRIELALSALMMFCHLLIKGGQLNQKEEYDLTVLLSNIEKVMREEA